MIIECKNCSTRLKVDESLLKPQGSKGEVFQLLRNISGEAAFRRERGHGLRAQERQAEESLGCHRFEQPERRRGQDHHLSQPGHFLFPDEKKGPAGGFRCAGQLEFLSGVPAFAVLLRSHHLGRQDNRPAPFERPGTPISGSCPPIATWSISTRNISAPRISSTC